MDKLPLLVGKRIKAARMLTGLTRKEFAAKTKISSATLRTWENPTAKRGGITRKGAQRFLEALQQEGVICSLTWLMQGIGSSPKLKNENSNLINSHLPITIDWDEEETVFKEIQFFKDVNANSVVVEILDDGMSPFYKIGDYVGGKWKSPDEINECLNKNCVIQIAHDQILFRRISYSKQLNGYVISCINPNTTVTEPVLFNVYIIQIAPVIWHRVKE